MHELFDMIAGVETGAIIASSLLTPNEDPETFETQKNKYFANHTMKFFQENTKSLYHRNSMPHSFEFFLYAFIIGTICSYSYLYSQNYNLFQDFPERVFYLQTMLKFKKKQPSQI